MPLFASFSSQASRGSLYKYERNLANVEKHFAEHVRQRQRCERQRRERLRTAADMLAADGETSNSRKSKRQKMMRRCELEYEYLSNLIDRVLLVISSAIVTTFVLTFIILSY